METTKSTRALPRVWKRIFQIPTGSAFYLTPKRQFIKRGFFRAEEIFSHLVGVCPILGATIWVNPFQRVKTTVLVRDARPGGKSSDIQYAPWETGGSVTTEQNEARFAPTQPSSDNSVTGPTS